MDRRGDLTGSLKTWALDLDPLPFSCLNSRCHFSCGLPIPRLEVMALLKISALAARPGDQQEQQRLSGACEKC